LEQFWIGDSNTLLGQKPGSFTNNKGRADILGSVTLDIYSKLCGKKRVDAVARVVQAKDALA